MTYDDGLLTIPLGQIVIDMVNAYLFLAVIVMAWVMKP